MATAGAKSFSALWFGGVAGRPSTYVIAKTMHATAGTLTSSGHGTQGGLQLGRGVNDVLRLGRGT